MNLLSGKNRIYQIIFMVGFLLLLIEIAGARLVASYLGNTIFVWAATITFVLAGSSAGYYHGGIQADRRADPEAISSLLMKSSITMLFIPILAGLIFPFTEFLSLDVATAVSAFPLSFASFCFGMFIPYAIKLTSSEGKAGEGSGRIFALSTIGGIAGALVTGFLLVPYVFLSHLFVLAAAVLLLLSWLTSRIMLIEIIPFGFLAFLAMTVNIMPFGEDVLFQEQSAYQLITVFGADVDGGIRAMALDAMVESMEYENGSAVYGYMHDARLGYGLTENPERALVIGIAGGTQIEDLKSSFPDISVDAIDMDGKAVEAGKRYFSLEDDDRTSIIIGDGRRAVKTLDAGYDIVLIDTFNGPSIPPHLATREFFSEVKGRMSEDGVLAMNIISSIRQDDSQLLNLMYNTIRTEFSEVIIIPSISCESGLRQDILLIATDNDAAWFRQDHSSKIFEPDFDDDRIFTDDWNPVESFVLWG